MSARIHSIISYVNHYRQVNEYTIITTLSNQTFWIALGALSLLFYLRLNTRLLRHLRRQSRKQWIWSQKKDLYNESIESSSFMCSKYSRHNLYFGVISKIGTDTDGNAQWSWHIYPMTDRHHTKRDVTTSIDGSDHENSTGPLVCKLACIKYIESKGYSVQYMNEWGR